MKQTTRAIRINAKIALRYCFKVLFGVISFLHSPLARMYSDISDDDTFVTQNTFKPEDSDNTSVDTDTVVDNVLSLQSEFGINVHKEEYGEFTLIVPEDKPNEIKEDGVFRFSKPKTTEELDKIRDERLPENTRKRDTWAVSVFEAWKAERIRRSNSNPVFALPCGGNNIEMKNMTKECLNECLSYFITEAKKKNGDDYPPDSLYALAMSIQHHLRENGLLVNFLDDNEFDLFRKTLDAVMKERSSRGLGLLKKQADVIEYEQEEVMWQKGVLGDDRPQTLLDSLIFSFGLHFALRSGKEHRALRFGSDKEPSQLSIHTDPINKRRYIEYKEDISKTNNGGLHHRLLKKKCTRAYENTDNPSRCIVRLFEKYNRLW